MKHGFYTTIEQDTIDNTDFRRVLYTGAYTQLVLMSLAPGEEIGLETHGNDQFFRFEAGEGRVLVGDADYAVADGDCVIVPAGATHNVINTSETDALKLYTLYSVPHHKDGTTHPTKAAAREEEFDGITTE